MRPLDPRLLRHARPAAVGVAVLSGAGAVTAAAVIAQARLLADGITSVFSGSPGAGGHPGGPDGLTVALLTVLAGVVAVRALAAWVSDAAAARAAAAAKSGLRRALLAKVLRRGPSPGDRSTELAQLATSGLDGLDGYFTGYLPKLILAVVVPLSVTVTIAVTDPLSGIAVAVTLPLVPLFGALIGMTAGRQARQRWLALATLGHHFLDVVTGLPTLKVFGRAGAQRGRIAEVTDGYRAAALGTLRLAFASGLALELVATMSVALVATETGLRLAYGHLGLTAALTVLILAPEAYLPLRAAAAQFHAAADGLTAAERVLDFLGRPEPEAPAPGGPESPGGGDTVTVENLTVRREGRAGAAPENLFLTLVPGRVTAVAGPSGSGKSTLIGVLLGFTEPTGGAVSRTVRDQAGWLPQDPVLFEGTVAANIRLGWPGAPHDAVAAAARAAALDDVALDRVLGARGAGLSAGQRRRVALARALLPDRPFLLLDEPTAGCDPAREALITATLRERAARGRAVLVASHHPAVLDIADETVFTGRALVHD